MQTEHHLDQHPRHHLHVSPRQVPLIRVSGSLYRRLWWTSRELSWYLSWGSESLHYLLWYEVRRLTISGTCLQSKLISRFQSSPWLPCICCCPDIGHWWNTSFHHHSLHDLETLQGEAYWQVISTFKTIFTDSSHVRWENQEDDDRDRSSAGDVSVSAGSRVLWAPQSHHGSQHLGMKWEILFVRKLFDSGVPHRHARVDTECLPRVSLHCHDVTNSLPLDFCGETTFLWIVQHGS